MFNELNKQGIATDFAFWVIEISIVRQCHNYSLFLPPHQQNVKWRYVMTKFTSDLLFEIHRNEARTSFTYIKHKINRMKKD